MGCKQNSQNKSIRNCNTNFLSFLQEKKEKFATGDGGCIISGKAYLTEFPTEDRLLRNLSTEKLKIEDSEEHNLKENFDIIKL